MNKIQNFIIKVLSLWTGIGFAISAIGTSGLFNIPPQILELFSQETAVILQETFDIIFQAVGAVILTAQFIRGIFIIKEPESSVKTLSKPDKVKYLINPFKPL